MENFYSIELKQITNHARIEHSNDYDQVNLFKGIDELGINPLFKITEGSVLHDFIGYQDTSNFAISEKLKSLILKEELKGYQTYEIQILDIQQKYFGFQCVSQCGPIIHPKEKGFYTGLKFDIDTWDGSDFFSPEGTVLLFCTEKAKHLIEENEFTNISIIELSKKRGYSFGHSNT